MEAFFAIAVVVMLLNVAVAAAVANYGTRKGLPFLPLLIASVFIAGSPVGLTGNGRARRNLMPRGVRAGVRGPR